MLVKSNEIHFVDGENQMTNAEQRADVGVPLGLRKHTLARIHQDHGELAHRGAGRHVPCILLVARRIGHCERPLVGREIPIGDIDRDLLLALVLESVQQQREIDIASGRT